MRRIPIVLLGLLLVAFALSILGASGAPVSDLTAYDSWLIRDAARVGPAAPQDVARGILANWRASLDRMQDHGGLRLDLLLLKGWTTAFGDSPASTATARGVAIILAAAAAYRLILRRVSFGGALTGAAALALVAAAGSPALSPVPNYRSALDILAQQRALTEPLFTVFGAESPLGYHHAQSSLRPGISVDVGWRSFERIELNAVLDRLHSGSVWVLGDTAHTATLDAIHSILISEGRTRDLCVRPTDRILVARYVNGGAVDACA